MSAPTMNLWEWFKKRHPAIPAPRKGAKLFIVGGGWGNAIDWMTFPTEVSGHKMPMPEEGDILICAMQSGKKGVWIFTDVRPCGDPPDMFFAAVFGIGYSDAVEFYLPSEKCCDSLFGMRHSENKRSADELQRLAKP